MSRSLSRRELLGGGVVLVGSSLPRLAAAAPRVGSAFPACSARDLLEHRHTQRDLGQRRTFVCAITGQAATEQMRHWLNNAEARFGRGGPIVALVALDVGPFAWDGVVWGQAREHTPVWRHGYVWLDRDGGLQRALGLPDEGPLPWAYVVDRGGDVLAAHRGIASDPEAEAMWRLMAAPDAG